MRDGFQLTSRVWSPAGASRGIVIIVHGLGEHAGRYQQLADDLVGAGWEVHAADQRGHGQSIGARGVLPAHESIRDDVLQSLGSARSSTTGPIVLFGHSMGGAMAAWAMAHRPAAADALVLSSPALRADLSWIQKVLMSTLGRIAPSLAIGNGLDVESISQDAAVVAAYRNDPLVHDRVTPRLAQAIVTAGEVVRAAAPRWSTPTLLLYSGTDRLVNSDGSTEFAVAAPAAVVTTERFDSLYHEIFNEPGRHAPVRVLLDWLDRRTSPGRQATAG